MEQLQPILDAFKGRYGWAATLATWLPALSFLVRAVVLPFNAKLQATMTEYLSDWAEEPEDATWVHNQVLTKGWYRALSFFMRLLVSVRLPTHADFHRLQSAKCEAAADKPETKPAGTGDITR